jgi:phosphoribosylformylglycinamidine (FGAM) synthase-like enzyme
MDTPSEKQGVQQDDANDSLMVPLVEVEEASVRSRRKKVQKSDPTTEKRKRHACRYMNVLARILFWASLLSLAAGVVWYSLELTKHG